MISFLKQRRRLRAEARTSASLTAHLRACRPLGRHARHTLFAGHLLSRVEVERGVYAMLFPRPYEDGADTDAALCALEAYAVYQEIPLVYMDLTAEQGHLLHARYPLGELCETDEGSGTFVLAVATELDSLDDIPTVTYGAFTLRAPTLTDAPIYARLCADAEGMRYYGYNDGQHPPRDGSRLIERRLSEFRRATALPLLAERDGVVLGECILYGFDGRRSASFSARLLPEARGRGLGRELFDAAVRLSREVLGLATLRATVHKDNLPSYRLLCRLFGEGRADGELWHFSLPL